MHDLYLLCQTDIYIPWHGRTRRLPAAAAGLALSEPLSLGSRAGGKRWSQWGGCWAPPCVPAERKAEPHYLLMRGAQPACMQGTRVTPGHLLGGHSGMDPTQWVVEGSRWHKGMRITGCLPPNIHFPNLPPSYSTDLLLPDPTLPGTAGSQLRQTSDGRQLRSKEEPKHRRDSPSRRESGTTKRGGFAEHGPQPAQNLAMKFSLFPAFSISSY